MSSFRRSNRRREEARRRFWGHALKAAFFLGVIGTTDFYAYQVGVQLTGGQVHALEQQVATLSESDRTRTDEARGLRQALDEARSQAASYKARLDEVAPSPDMQDLLALIRSKLEQGLEPSRLASFIAAADRPRTCHGTVNKRFVVKTPLYKGKNTWVGYEDLVTVTAEGTPATGAGGALQEWFDPDKPVTVRFTAQGGKESEISGKLPMSHILLVKNAELRFSFTPGGRGFLDVAGDRCDAPARAQAG